MFSIFTFLHFTNHNKQSQLNYVNPPNNTTSEVLYNIILTRNLASTARMNATANVNAGVALSTLRKASYWIETITKPNKNKSSDSTSNTYSMIAIDRNISGNSKLKYTFNDKS